MALSSAPLELELELEMERFSLRREV